MRDAGTVGEAVDSPSLQLFASQAVSGHEPASQHAPIAPAGIYAGPQGLPLVPAPVNVTSFTLWTFASTWLADVKVS